MVVVSASAALTMEKVGGYDNSENEDEPLEVVAIKASTNVSLSKATSDRDQVVCVCACCEHQQPTAAVLPV